MKKKTTYFLSIVFCSFIYSCSELDINKDDSSEQYEQKVYNKSELAAIELVKLFGAEQTSSTKSQALDDIKIISVETASYMVDDSDLNNKATKLNSSEEVRSSFDLYTISFEKSGKKGFSIVSPDKGLSTLYAYTENGNISDTTFNIGLAITLENIPEIAKEQFKEYYSDSALLKSTKAAEYINIEPLVKTEWGQSVPYNKACPPGNGCTFTLAGCTTIALAQVIAAKRITAASKNGYFDFSQMTVTRRPSIDYQQKTAEFIRYIGDLVKAKYGCTATGANPEDIRSTLDAWRVSYAYYEGNIDVDKTANNMWTYNAPLITSGFKNTGDKTGHVWLLCGVKGNFNKVNRQYVAVDKNAVLFYCNWGWDGFSDGWYTTPNVERPRDTEGINYNQRNSQLWILNSGGRPSQP